MSLADNITGRRKIKFITVLGALWLLVALALTAGNVQALGPDGCEGSGGVTIALDPGHGANDPGTSNSSVVPKLVEKDITLDIAYLAKDKLVALGYRVCLTRIDDSTNPSNTERAQYANSVQAAALVLIHLNGSSAESTNYTKTFWGKKSKDMTFSQVMNRALYPALSAGPDGQPVNLTNGGVGQFASGALLKSNMPATLVESVFLTNNAEAKRLSATGAGSRRDQIAAAIAQGVYNFVRP